VDPSLEQPVPAMQRGMPDTHLRHWVEPGTRAYELVGQVVQLVAPVLFWYVPALQGRHSE
jgi:hypothetical protein